MIIVLFSMLGKKSSQKITNKDVGYALLNSNDVVIAQTGNLDSVVTFTGDLEPLNQAVISSEIDAEVLKVLVNEGQSVKKDQVLAILDDTDLREAASEQQALLDISKQKYQLDKKKMDLQKELYDQGFLSKIAYDELVVNSKVSEETIKQQQASLYRAKKKLSDTVIKAPFAGVVYKKSIDAGQLASKNGQLFSLANLDVMQIKAAIPSDLINSVSVNQAVKFILETDIQDYNGKITRVNPVAEAGTRSYMIYVNFDNSKHQLKSGQFVKGQIIVASLNNVVQIPTDSIRKSNESSYVYVLQSDKVVRKPVNVLLTNSLLDMSAVSGVESGDKVLAGNVLSVKAGDKARVLN